MSPAESIPRLAAADSTRPFLREGYNFISGRCQALGSTAFATRLMGREVVCARGAEAARMFFHPERFTRQGAAPPTATRLLQGKESVQQINGQAHHQRKALFLRLLDPAATARLVELFDARWKARIAAWPQRPEVVVQTEAERALCAAVFGWTGLPAPDGERELIERARELGAMIDGAGAYGPRWLRGLRLRRRHERIIRAHVTRLREAGGMDSPAAAIANFRGTDGALLSMRAATNELINLLRPTVAVARWITFAALALHRHPDLRGRFGEPGYLQAFVQEVRRYYPFFPAIGGRVREPFEWSGHRFANGDWVMLDLYGTNHDPALWKEPVRFDPDRFKQWDPNAFSFIPQGGGEYPREHRCPGEDPSIALLMSAVGGLLQADYAVPRQNLRYPMNRFPTGPRSGFIVGQTRRPDSAAPR